MEIWGQPIYIHAWLRLVLVLWSAVFLILLVRSLVLAYAADYGWPWDRRSRTDRRSDLDREVLIFIVLLAILSLLSVPSGVARVILQVPLPLEYGSLLVTAYMAVFARSSFVIWRHVRRVRLERKRAEGR